MCLSTLPITELRVRYSPLRVLRTKIYRGRCVTDIGCHAVPGILGMPTGPFLYADQLIGTLRNKSASKYALYAPCLQVFSTLVCCK